MSSLCHSNHKPCACSTFITSYIILKMIHVPQGSLPFSFLHVLLPPNGKELNLPFCAKKGEKTGSEASIHVEQAAKSTKHFNF